MRNEECGIEWAVGSVECEEWRVEFFNEECGAVCSVKSGEWSFLMRNSE